MKIDQSKVVQGLRIDTILKEGLGHRHVAARESRLGTVKGTFEVQGQIVRW